MKTDSDRLLELEIQMKTALEGVANFRNFQNRAVDFFTRHEERELSYVREQERKKREEERISKKRAAIHYWWLGLLSALIVAGFSILLTEFFQLRNEHHISEATTVSRSQDAALPSATEQSHPEVANAK